MIWGRHDKGSGKAFSFVVTRLYEGIRPAPPNYTRLRTHSLWVVASTILRPCALRLPPIELSVDEPLRDCSFKCVIAFDAEVRGNKVLSLVY